MKEKDVIFLCYAEALRAIQNDLAQYCPQPLLLRHLAQLILGEKVFILEDKHRTGLWIAMGKKGKCRLITYDQMPEHVCAALANKQFSDDVLAKICGCVFQERAYTGDQFSGKEKLVQINLKAIEKGYNLGKGGLNA